MAPPSPTESTPWLSDDEQRAWRSYISGTRRLLDRLEQDLKQHGLSHDDYGVLVALSESPEGRLRMADLAERSVESRSRLSRHIGRMESRGLVRREACPNDRRGSFAVLTSAGRDVMEETAPHHVTAVRHHFFDCIDAEDLAVIDRTFGRVDRALADPPPAGGDEHRA